jgi:hypothetical protein
VAASTITFRLGSQHFTFQRSPAFCCRQCVLLCALAGTCRRFNWGGCQGNNNNFASQELCMYTCAAAMAPPPTFPPVPLQTQQMPDAWIVNGASQQAPAPQASSAGGLLDVRGGCKVVGTLLLALLFLCVIAP